MGLVEDATTNREQFLDLAIVDQLIAIVSNPGTEQRVDAANNTEFVSSEQTASGRIEERLSLFGMTGRTAFRNYSPS